jgi:signal transduction histidine kinase
MNNSDIYLAIIFITLLVLLLIAGIVITFFVSGRQRIRQEIQMAENKLVFEKELRQVETEVSENMMSHFAAELHDNIGQLITALYIQVDNLKLDNPNLEEGFKPVELNIAEINQQLRLLSRTLNNEYIGRIGLLTAIQLEVERLSGLKRFKVHYNQPQGQSNLEKNEELMIFRIFQEIVQNALRHALARNLFITIDTIDNNFHLSVRDDGRGFDSNHIFDSHKASGLHNILKRAKLAGAACTINSSPGKGSLFILKKVSKLS